MQISSISPNFTGRRDNIDALISLDDRSIQQLAYLKTNKKANEKKHRRITNTLIAAAPVAAGLSAAVFSKGKTKIFSKEVSGLAAKLANGLKVGGLWAAALGAVGLVGVVNNELVNSSDKVRKFEKDHPILSIIGLLAAGFGAISLTGKLAGKLASVEAPKFLQKGTEQFARFLNTNKSIASVKQGTKNLISKVPSALKEAGETALDWAPQVLLLGGLFHSLGHRTAVNREFGKNYSELKEKQLMLSKARQRELQIENDFLRQNAQNCEELALVKDPLKNLPDEVIDKINVLNEDAIEEEV